MTKQKYITQACDYCRKKKRKCSNEIPCIYCINNNQKCTHLMPRYKRGYKPLRKKKIIVEKNMTKQKYVKHACDYCRKKRRKCSNDIPCNHCVNDDQICTHLMPRYKRGPKPLRKKKKMIIVEETMTNSKLTIYGEDKNSIKNNVIIKTTNQIVINLNNPLEKSNICYINNKNNNTINYSDNVEDSNSFDINENDNTIWFNNYMEDYNNNNTMSYSNHIEDSNSFDINKNDNTIWFNNYVEDYNLCYMGNNNNTMSYCDHVEDSNSFDTKFDIKKNEYYSYKPIVLGEFKNNYYNLLQKKEILPYF